MCNSILLSKNKKNLKEFKKINALINYQILTNIIKIIYVKQLC
ncbi:hypothetical protein C674_2060 [Clostridioides difficile F480]|nr:hypothetical protein HMPREF1123_02835 [Clostridioides difficile 050-P50-2011]EQE06266.1 hypothetical protein QAO_2072 [Clostridioides difficile CD3]EQE30229.1 hypothetical protein QC5_2128 [Clostridioides difficile CD34]EQE39958.1 hypothetical protein QCA_2268 [Clostridioides difficile CD40]EQE43691.1 hypothetical protein QCC_1800 [Clostridioides difficile CD41]EQF75413.1 hypothetical protein QGO_1891 [Clostridioides difficile CD212]EQG03208.1 hypothetical protein QI7_1624 [Clostridioides 